jgi:RNA processing factor Prp31
MNAIAPNLTNLVGQLVVAELISHAGSLTNLAKNAASNIQLLGASTKHGMVYYSIMKSAGYFFLLAKKK